MPYKRRTRPVGHSAQELVIAKEALAGQREELSAARGEIENARAAVRSELSGLALDSRRRGARHDQGRACPREEGARAGECGCFRRAG